MKKKVKKVSKVGVLETPEVVTESSADIQERETFSYPIPETKEEYLALHKCLKDLGVNSIGDLEVRASKL